METSDESPAGQSSTSASGSLSESNWSDQRPYNRGQDLKDVPSHGASRSASDLEESLAESLHIENPPKEVVIAQNGDITVGDQFWSVFCKEASFLHPPHDTIAH